MKDAFFVVKSAAGLSALARWLKTNAYNWYTTRRQMVDAYGNRIIGLSLCRFAHGRLRPVAETRVATIVIADETFFGPVIRLVKAHAGSRADTAPALCGRSFREVPDEVAQAQDPLTQEAAGTSHPRPAADLSGDIR